MEPHSRGELFPGVKGFVKRLMQSSNVYEGLRELKVRGRDSDTGELKLVDLLEDKLVSSKKVAKNEAKYRAIDSTSMFAQIEAAYSEMKPVLQKAAGLS